MDFETNLRRAQGGDQDALESLLESLHQQLTTGAERMLGDALKQQVNRSDILQDAYLELVRDLGSFTGSDEPKFRAWAGAILENAARRQGRRFGTAKRKAPERTSEKNALAAAKFRPTPTPSSALARVEDLFVVARAMKTLSDHHRTVIELAVFGKHSIEDVAAKLDRTVPATRMLLSRARASLALAIEQEDVSGQRGTRPSPPNPL